MDKTERILSYLVGGITGLIGALLFLLLIQTPNDTRMFLRFWLSSGNFLPFIAVIVGFFLAGLLFVFVANLNKKEKNQKEERRLHDETVLMITHQMRTGLTTAGWGVQSFISENESTLDEKHKQDLAGIDHTIHNIVVMTVSIYDMARLKSGQLNLAMQHIDLGVLEKGFTGSIQRFHFGAKKKGVTLHSLVTLDKTIKFACDPERLYAVLDNLLENAINYSGSGKKETLVSIMSDAHFLIITVTDTGIGIPEAEQSYVFNKFYRASNAIREADVGTGIGLYLSREYVHGHGGTIILNSEENVGTTFTVRIPLKGVVQAEGAMKSV